MSGETYKTESCQDAKHFVNDLYFCTDKEDCEYKITIGQGKLHSFCFLQLEGIREFIKKSGLEDKTQLTFKGFLKRLKDGR